MSPKKRQHSIEFAMAKIHETYNSKHKSGQNFGAESRTATTGAGPGWLVYVRTPYLATQWYRISVRMEGTGLFKNFVNFVRIGSWPFSTFRQNPPDCYQASPTIGWGPLSAQRPPQGHRSLALGAVRTCPKICLLSLVTDLLSESRISDKWSQVTPLSELIEMVQ